LLLLLLLLLLLDDTRWYILLRGCESRVDVTIINYSYASKFIGIISYCSVENQSQNQIPVYFYYMNLLNGLHVASNESLRSSVVRVPNDYLEDLIMGSNPSGTFVHTHNMLSLSSFKLIYYSIQSYSFYYNIDRTLHALWLVKNPCFIRV